MVSPKIMASHQCQIPVLDRKSHLAGKPAQLLNLFAFRREEGNKVLGFTERLHFCKKLFSHTMEFNFLSLFLALGFFSLISFYENSSLLWNFITGHLN